MPTTLCVRGEGMVSLSDFTVENSNGVDNTGNVCLWPSEEVGFMRIGNSDRICTVCSVVFQLTRLSQTSVLNFGCLFIVLLFLFDLSSKA